jgi:hypothetical protein
MASNDNHATRHAIEEIHQPETGTTRYAAVGVPERWTFGTPEEAGRRAHAVELGAALRNPTA